MPVNEPTLSILLPAYNAGKYISIAVKSILSQTYKDFEILICDDGSTDGTYTEIRKFEDSRIRIFKNDVNKGKNATCTFLLSSCRGKFISVHDADDISLPTRFEKQIKFLEGNPDFALCGVNFVSFSESGKIVDRSSLEQDPVVIREKIKSGSQFHGPTIVFRKEIISRVGGFYRYFVRAEDIDFTMRVAERYKTTNLSEHLYLYRHVFSSLTNNLEGYNLERLGHAKLLYYLAKEREQNNGMDSLMLGADGKINNLMETFMAEYRADPTVALRRGVFRLLGMKMFGNAVKLSWLAMTTTINELNVKCFIYAIFATVKGEFQLLMNNETIDQYIKQLND
jgi:glycosyltransferase involved in cell wall biosynthesis